MSESFDANSVYQYLKTNRLSVTVVPEVSSTNTVLAEQAQNGATDGTVLSAHCQTAGRGRMGRSFLSPKGGLYFSVLLRPPFSLARSNILTPAAAVSMAKALESTCGIAPQIKWVNDLYLNERKICGILTEAMPDKSGAGFDYVIIGIGVNLYPAAQALPAELAQKVGTVFATATDIDYRPQILAAFLDNFFALYPALPHEELYNSYKERLFILNREALITQGSEIYQAQVLDLNEDFSLCVRTHDGKTKNLLSGEVSLKKV